jgi:hypothetical protein
MLTDWLKKYNKYSRLLSWLMLISQCVTKLKFYLLPSKPPSSPSSFSLLHFKYTRVFSTSTTNLSQVPQCYVHNIKLW